MKIKPINPKGTRDFLPEEVAKRNFIFDTIKKRFQLYGFLQIETPVLERIETLQGKYGDEGDKLLFKVLNSGDYLSKVNSADFIEKGEDGSVQLVSKKLTSKIVEKGLRYDLTVPLARYAVQHQSDLAFPFRRFHIGPVWRADRPGKGRYQEFYQCDADIIGTDSLFGEVDLLSLMTETYTALKIQHVIKVNNRKILQGVIESCNLLDKMTLITTIIDKLDKIQWSGVQEELKKLNIPDADLNLLMDYMQVGDLNQLAVKLANNPMGMKGIEELKFVMQKVDGATIEYDITLARGIDYYTGFICEVKCTNAEMGSIGAGGRYDNLTSVFGGQNMSGVGVSFGVERIYDIMEEQGLFPATIFNSTKVLITNFDQESQAAGFDLLRWLRTNNISSEQYPSSGKLDKQLKYANNKKIPFVILLGSNEIANNTYTVKNMDSGEQRELKRDEILSFLN